MFFYVQNGIANIIVSLSLLETAKALLGQAATPLHHDFPRWNQYGKAISRAMEDGGKIHVTIERESGRRPPLNGWRGPLDAAPEPHRTDVIASLDFFAARHGCTYDRATVELIGLDGNREVKG